MQSRIMAICQTDNTYFSFISHLRCRGHSNARLFDLQHLRECLLLDVTAGVGAMR